jgi:hypothetical protein
MKNLILTSMIVLTVVSAGVAATDSAQAQSWIAIASKPVASYQPYRGYYGSQTYIGQYYPRRTYNTRVYRPVMRRHVVNRRSGQAARAIAAALIIGAILAHRR